MIDLFDGDHIETDLRKFSAGEVSDADLLEAFLDELAGCENGLWELPKWAGDYHSPFFNCRAIVAWQQHGYNLYRMRPLSGRLRSYRIIYAYNGLDDEVFVLAIVVKKPDSTGGDYSREEYFNYELDHPITRRVFDEYELKKLPRLN